MFPPTSVVDVDDGVGEGLGIDGCTDDGAVPIRDWLGGGFLLRCGDGGDLSGGCCGGYKTEKGGGENRGILELMDDTTICQDCHMRTDSKNRSVQKLRSLPRSSRCDFTHHSPSAVAAEDRQVQAAPDRGKFTAFPFVVQQAPTAVPTAQNVRLDAEHWEGSGGGGYRSWRERD